MLNTQRRMNVQAYPIENLWQLIKEQRPHAFGYLFRPRSSTPDGLPWFKYVGVPVQAFGPTWSGRFPLPPLRRFVVLFPDRLCEPHQLASGRFDRLELHREHAFATDALVESYISRLIDLPKSTVQKVIAQWRHDDYPHTSDYTRVVREINNLQNLPTLVFDEPAATQLPEVQAHYQRVNGVR